MGGAAEVAFDFALMYSLIGPTATVYGVSLVYFSGLFHTTLKKQIISDCTYLLKAH